jgi:hypothetical protein
VNRLILVVCIISRDFMKKSLRDEENAAAIRYIKGNHAHSNPGDLLARSGRKIPGVKVDGSHGRKPFPAIGLLFHDNYFAVVKGMQHLTLRLPGDHAELLISYGALLDTEIGFPGWISFDPITLRVDVDVWVEEAFKHSSR